MSKNTSKKMSKKNDNKDKASGIGNFTTRKEALAWMYEKLKNEEYFDNERFAFIDNQYEMAAYDKQASNGCCGSFDQQIRVGGQLATVGCNYGH